MKPPVLIGIILALVFVLAWVFAPALRGSQRKAAEAAQAQAALAQRQLARHSLTLRRLAPAAAVKTIEGARLEAAAAGAQTELARAAGELAEQARKSQRMAERYGLSLPDVPRLSADAGGVRAAADVLDGAVRANEDLLKKAIADAKAAMGIDGNALGVAYALGSAEYVRAVGLMVEAQKLREQQDLALARLLDAGSRWKRVRGYLDYSRGLDVSAIVTQLRADLDTLATLRAEAGARVTTLANELKQREDELAQAEAALRTKQAELLELEQRGFDAGHDDGPQSFAAFRERYLSLAAELRALQRRDDELRFGGRPGAELVGEELLEAEIRGGEPTAGVDELRRRLEMAQERARRLDRANLSLEEHIRYVTETGQRATTEAAQYQNRLQQLEAQQKTIVEEVQTLAAAAFDKESEALAAADAAVRAFSQASRAGQTWIQAAREVQRERDPNRKNPRLLLVTRDPYLEQVGRSAEAAARLLLARVHAGRLDATQGLIEDMGVFAQMNPAMKFDRSVFETQVQTARAAALETLDKARELYASISDKLSGQPTAWVPQAALAATYHLLARVDADRSAAYREQALDVIRKALDKREQFPYARPLVAFRDHLGGAAPALTPAPSEAGAPAAPGTPANAEDEGGFFMDEEDK